MGTMSGYEYYNATQVGDARFAHGTLADREDWPTAGASARGKAWEKGAGRICPNTACRAEGINRIARAKREWECTADAVPQLICMIDSQGRIQRANRSVESWGLASVAEVRGRTLHDLLHPGCADPACYLRQFDQQALQDACHGQGANCEADDRVVDRYLQIQTRPVEQSRTDAQDTSFMVCVIHDITDLKAAERALLLLNDELCDRVKARTAQMESANRRMQQEIQERLKAEVALRASREAYRQLVECMHEGLVMVDEDWRVSYANQHMLDLLGYTEEEVIGSPASRYIAPESEVVWSESLLRRRQGDESPYEIGLRGKRGDTFYAKVSPRIIRDGDGHPRGSFAVVTDISSRILAEEELRKSRSELKLLSAQLLTAQEMERKRIASELHDGIGQSMSAVTFSVEEALQMLSADGGASARAALAELVPRIRSAIEEVRRITMDLRPPTLDDLGILPTLGWFCREFQGIYRDIDIEKIINIQEQDVSPALKTVIFRILQEAFNNAAKHACATRLGIRLDKTCNAIELTVEDNGCGFEPAEVANRSATERGYGLASMRERAEFSGGTFNLASHPGQGTIIRVSWPRLDGAPSGRG